MVMDKIHGRSKGFGFVTFATAASASKALEQPSKEIQVGTTEVASGWPPYPYCTPRLWTGKKG